METSGTNEWTSPFGTWANNETNAMSTSRPKVIYQNPLDLSRSDKHHTLTRSIIYIAPALLFFGTIGNILSVVILWRRKALNRNTTTIYLVCLAVIDELVLIVGLTELWLSVTFDLSIRELHQFGCTVFNFLIYTLFIAEPWVLVNLTLERLAAVFVPHKSKILFTKRKATLGLIFSLAVIIALNCHWFWTTKLHHYNIGTRLYFKLCGISNIKYAYFIRVQFQTIHLLMGSAIPFVILFLSNVVIIFQVFVANKRRKKMNTTVQTKMSSMTVILLVISFTFLALSLPQTVSLKVVNNYLQSKHLSFSKTEFLFLVLRSCKVIAYLNYVLNFYLYFFTSPRFRKELKVMFAIGVKHKDVVSSLTSATTISLISIKKNQTG